MSDTERVRAWRQRLKEGGLVPITIWVHKETKARYEDLAQTYHRSTSELAQLALDAYRLDPAMVSAPVTDTAQLRALIREELDQTTAILMATVTTTVTEIITAALPAMVETALQRYVSDTVTDTETATPQEPSWLATAEAFASDMATATNTDTAASEPPQGPPAPQVSDTETATVTETQVPTAADPEATTARTPPGQRKLTPRQAAALRAKRQRGVPIKDLMDDYGLSRASVHRYLSTPRLMKAASPGSVPDTATDTATETAPPLRGRRAARGPARRRTAPTPSD